jgi:hypothetical protein
MGTPTDGARERVDGHGFVFTGDEPKTDRAETRSLRTRLIGANGGFAAVTRYLAGRFFLQEVTEETEAELPIKTSLITAKDTKWSNRE